MHNELIDVLQIRNLIDTLVPFWIVYPRNKRSYHSPLIIEYLPILFHSLFFHTDYTFNIESLYFLLMASL